MYCARHLLFSILRFAPDVISFLMPTPVRLFIKFLQTLMAVLIIAYAGACLYLWLRQTRFIFFPSAVIEKTPAALQMAYEDVWLPVKSGAGTVERIHGWWIPAAGDAAGVVLYLHGNGINVGANVNHANRFHQMGFSVLLIDYRGYGLSEGSFPTEAQIYQDVETAWDYLITERRVNPQEIFLYGHSLGGAIGIELATRHPDAGALIVEGSFTSMRAMVDYRYEVFRVFPVDLLLHQQFNSIAKVGKLQMPVLFIHGTSDDVTPYSMSQQLFAAANEPKQLFLVPGADHNNVATISGDPYIKTVRRFIEQAKAQQKQEPVKP